MKRNLFMTAALALAGLFGFNKQAAAAVNTKSEAKANNSFLSHVSYMHGDAKGYGMALARSGSAKKSNRLRYSHNAKVKRRGIC